MNSNSWHLRLSWKVIFTTQELSCAAIRCLLDLNGFLHRIHQGEYISLSSQSRELCDIFKNTFNVALDYNFSVYKKKWLCSEALLNDQAPHPIFKVNPRLSLGTDQNTKKSWIQAEFVAIGEGRTRYCVVNLQHPFHAQRSLPHNKSVQCLENLWVSLTLPPAITHK